MKVGEIKKGIAIPEREGGISKFLQSMEVGDCVDIQFDEGESINRVMSTVCQAARRRGMKMSRRKIDKHTMRVWRVE